jgi:hypothetical protein
VISSLFFHAVGEKDSGESALARPGLNWLGAAHLAGEGEKWQRRHLAFGLRCGAARGQRRRDQPVRPENCAVRGRKEMSD